MKKLMLLFSCLLLVCFNDTLLAQQPWLTGGNSIGIGGTTTLGTTNSKPLQFIVNSYQAMVILANGNVGIGTTDPHYALQVVGDVVDSGSFFATNIATSNSISVGQFRIVDGVIDSIVSPAGILQLSAASVNANGTFTAEQTITAGTSDTAITINGDAGTITSGLQKISFGNDTIVTTATVKAGNVIANKLTVNDTMTIPMVMAHRIGLYPGDSIVRVGDSSIVLNPSNNNIYGEGPLSCGTCPPVYSSIALGINNNVRGTIYSCAMGDYNNITQYYDMVIGTGNTATGVSNITIGTGLTNNIEGSILMGGFGSSSNTPAISIIPDFTNLTPGFVGIGTTAPSELLDVNGTANAAYTAGEIAVFRNGNSNVFINSNMPIYAYNPLTKSGDNGIFWTDRGGGSNSSSGFVIAPWGSSAGIRIDASGNVTVGGNAFIGPDNSNYLSLGYDGANGMIDFSGNNNASSLLIDYYSGKNVVIGGNPSPSIHTDLSIPTGDIFVGTDKTKQWTTSNYNTAFETPVGSIGPGTVWLCTDLNSNGNYEGFGMTGSGWAWITSSAIDNSAPAYTPMSLTTNVGQPPYYWSLNLCGTLVAASVYVTGNPGGCDYIFDSTYNRMNFEQQEKYYSTNKHLEGVASAATMQEHGICVDSTLMGILKNVEEARLDNIQLYKIIQKQQEQIQDLIKENEEMKEVIKKDYSEKGN